MSENKIMTEQDLINYTGAYQKSGQIEWLKKNAIPFKVKVNGHPSVLWSDIEGKPKSNAITESWNPAVLV